jgi:hypothetical protein
VKFSFLSISITILIEKVTFLTVDIAVQELIQLKSDLEQVIALTQELITTTATSSSALQEVGLSIHGILGVNTFLIEDVL